jgi:hypothetical protein
MADEEVGRCDVVHGGIPKGGGRGVLEDWPGYGCGGGRHKLGPGVRRRRHRKEGAIFEMFEMAARPNTQKRKQMVFKSSALTDKYRWVVPR